MVLQLRIQSVCLRGSGLLGLLTRGNGLITTRNALSNALSNKVSAEGKRLIGVRQVMQVIYRYSTASRSSRGCNFPGIPAESVDPLSTSGSKGVPNRWIIRNPHF